MKQLFIMILSAVMIFGSGKEAMGGTMAGPDAMQDSAAMASLVSPMWPIPFPAAAGSIREDDDQFLIRIGMELDVARFGFRYSDLGKRYGDAGWIEVGEQETVPGTPEVFVEESLSLSRVEEGKSDEPPEDSALNDGKEEGGADPVPIILLLMGLSLIMITKGFRRIKGGWTHGKISRRGAEKGTDPKEAKPQLRRRQIPGAVDAPGDLSSRFRQG